MLADMGAQPGTRDPALAPATTSSDNTSPVVTIASPAEGAAIPHGTSVTASGSAADTGGIVAGVEVSTDGGASWHPAQGKQNWTYTYIQKGLSSATLQVRAVDDSANIGAAATRGLTLTGPYTVFGTQVPAVADSGDGGAYELGMKITPTVDGFITGVRFYKSTANTGTHTGSLWNSAGQRVASATFTSETASGWQKVLFSQPVAVGAGQTYTVSYTAPRGHYATKDYQWASFGFTDPPLTAAGGFGTPPAGVYGNPDTLPDEQLQQRQLLRRCRLRHHGQHTADCFRAVASKWLVERPAVHHRGGYLFQASDRVERPAQTNGHGRYRRCGDHGLRRGGPKSDVHAFIQP